ERRDRLAGRCRRSGRHPGSLLHRLTRPTLQNRGQKGRPDWSKNGRDWTGNGRIYVTLRAGRESLPVVNRARRFRYTSPMQTGRYGRVARDRAEDMLSTIRSDLTWAGWAPPTPVERASVLLVANDPEIARQITEALDAVGITVSRVRTGHEAEEAV